MNMLRFLLFAMTILSAHAGQLQIVPEKLELTGRDSMHGVIVSLTADDGKLSDATRRVTYSMDQTQTAAVDSR